MVTNYYQAPHAMPKVSDAEHTTKLTRDELADVLGVSPAAISRSAHEKYFCKGYPVWEWAEWHPRGKTVMHYSVPQPVLKQKLSRDEYPKYDIFD